MGVEGDADQGAQQWSPRYDRHCRHDRTGVGDWPEDLLDKTRRDDGRLVFTLGCGLWRSFSASLQPLFFAAVRTAALAAFVAFLFLASVAALILCTIRSTGLRGDLS